MTIKDWGFNYQLPWITKRLYWWTICQGLPYNLEFWMTLEVNNLMFYMGVHMTISWSWFINIRVCVCVCYSFVTLCNRFWKVISFHVKWNLYLLFFVGFTVYHTCDVEEIRRELPRWQDSNDKCCVYDYRSVWVWCPE